MVYTTARTLYDVLEVNKSASRNEIKDAYRKMAFKHHPDKNPNKNQAVSNFQEVQGAYEILYDDSKRTRYNCTIGLKQYLPTRSGPSTGFAGDPATANPQYPPQAPRRPDSFWSDLPKPRTYEPPQSTVFDEDDWSKPDEWSGAHYEPDQDWYNEWERGQEKRRKDFEESIAREEERRKKDAEEREAADLFNRRKQAEANLPSNLAATLSRILRLIPRIEEMEAENKAADTVIEDWIGVDEQESEFFEKIYERNVQLNALRRDFEAAMKKYRKLGKIMKTIDPKQGDEAEKIYRKLQKRTQKAREKKTQDFKGCDNQGRQANAGRHRQRGDKPNTREAYHRQAGKKEMMDEKDGQETGFGQEAEDESNRLRAETPSTPEQSYTPDDEAIHIPSIVDCHSPGYQADVSADGSQADDEIILYQSRVLHTQHLDVSNELWEIAEGAHMCCYCGNIQTVFECPRYEQCALRACEGCRRAPLRNR